MVKITIELNEKKIMILSAVLMFIIISGFTFGARKVKEQPKEEPGIAMQFVSGFTCMIMTCGWPSIVLMILPAIAIWVWKKYISLG